MAEVRDISTGDVSLYHIDELVALVYYSTDEFGFGEWGNDINYPVEIYKVRDSSEAYDMFIRRNMFNGHPYCRFNLYIYLDENDCSVYIPGWDYDDQHYGGHDDYGDDNLVKCNFWLMRLRYSRQKILNAIASYVDKGSSAELLLDVVDQQELDSMETVENVDGHPVIGKNMF